MPFRNLFFQFTPLRDHNFSDFLDRLDEVKEVFLEAKFREGYREGTIEPYFDPVIPLSLSPTSCLSFLRAYAKWPITERDYYLSKLFQYLYLPIEIRYGIDYHDEDRVRRRLEGILGQIPDEVLRELHRWDWWSFYSDTCELDLDELCDRLSERLGDFTRSVRQGLPVREGVQGGAAGFRRRRGRQPANVERDSIVVNCLDRGMERFQVCQTLDRKGFDTTGKMRAWGAERWVEAWADPNLRNTVQQVFSKAVKRSKAVKSQEFPFSFRRSIAIGKLRDCDITYMLLSTPGPGPPEQSAAPILALLTSLQDSRK